LVYYTLPRLLQGPGSCAFFQGQSNLPVDPLDITAAPHQRFPVQGHILSTSGDALIADPKYTASSKGFRTFTCMTSSKQTTTQLFRSARDYQVFL
jgi:hypothetical protein